MIQLDSYQNFEQEQQLKRRAKKRHQRHVRQIPIDETETWLFTTDLDEAIDSLAAGLEVFSCH